MPPCIVPRRDNMERATHECGLDQPAVADRPVHVGWVEVLQARPEREVRRGRFLCLEPTEAMDRGERSLDGSFEEALACQRRAIQLAGGEHLHMATVPVTVAVCRSGGVGRTQVSSGIGGRMPQLAYGSRDGRDTSVISTAIHGSTGQDTPMSLLGPPEPRLRPIWRAYLQCYWKGRP